MGRLAVVGKEATLGEPWGRRPEPRSGGVRTGDGSVAILDRDDHIALYRHGIDHYVPPHRIDHAAHLRELTQLGCDRVLALSSVGALRAELAVGTFVAPHDFIALDQPPVVASDGEHQHCVPGFSPSWRAQVVATWSEQCTDRLLDGGVYWQANGPRFETPAEIAMMALHADVVGMTVASECVAANQLGIAYAAVCVVDNLANGLQAEPLTVEEYARGQAINRERLLASLAVLVPALAP